MKQVGIRRERPIAMQASGTALADGARFCETMARLAGIGLMRQGVYRFKSHQAANALDDDCLARAMGRLAARRA
jgi:hypothetical protein